MAVDYFDGETADYAGARAAIEKIGAGWRVDWFGLARYLAFGELKR